MLRQLYQSFLKRPKYLEDFNRFGRVVPELNDATIREIFVYSYRLIYSISEESVLFIAVVHGKRLLKNHQNNIGKNSKK